jgi:hypothetical protein
MSYLVRSLRSSLNTLTLLQTRKWAIEEYSTGCAGEYIFRCSLIGYFFLGFHIATTGNVFFYFCKRACVDQKPQWYCYKPCASCVYVKIWYIYISLTIFHLVKKKHNMKNKKTTVFKFPGLTQTLQYMVA